jgi:hypothetical protein
MIAFVVCAVLILAYISLYSVLTHRPSGQHARPHEGRHELADPADRTDPDGDAYVAQLRGAGRLPYITDEADHWDEPAPSGRVEVLRAPPPLIRCDTSPAAVADLYAALRDWEPDEDDPAIDDTGRQPIAVCTWGKTAAELADELAARYLT